MKKIFFLLLLLPFLASAQKKTPGNYTYIAQKYEWDAGVFKGLNMPAGPGPAAFIAGQVQRAGAVYYDTVGADAGDYIYNGTAWVLQGSPASLVLPDELIQPGYVTYSGTGLKFYISPSIARINGVIYGTDQDSVTLSAADPDDPRKDVIYLATTGVEVLTGTPAGPAAEPQLDADQIKLTVIDVPALATTPGITTQVVYDENTESTVGNVGTTIDPDNTTNVFRGAKSLNVTNMSNSDRVQFDIALPLLVWDLSSVDAISFFIKLKAVLPATAYLRIRFFVGTSTVGGEVTIPVNRANITNYQAVTIPKSSFGNIANQNITRVSIRFTNTVAGDYAGFYLDYMHFVDGLVQPGPAGAVNSVTLQGPAGWTFQGPTTGDVIQNIIPGGASTQMLGGDGVVKTDSSVHSVDPIDSYTKNNDGATINTATKSIGFHLVNSTYNGLMSSLQYRQLDTLLNQTVEPGGGGDSLVYAIDAFRTGIKDIIAGTNVTFTVRDTAIVINATGGGGGSGITEVVADYGLTNVNDSTLRVDTFAIATKARVIEVADSLAAALGVGAVAEVSKDFTLSNDSLYNTNWVNVVDYGADPTGVSNSVTAFTNAIATGKTVFVPSGTFLLTGAANTALFTLNVGQKIFGMGEASVLKTTSNARIIGVEPFSIVDNLSFLGSSGKTISSNQYQSGISAAGNDTGWTVQNVTLRDFGGSDGYLGGAIYIAAIVGGNTMGATMNNINIYNSYNGITLNSRAEYLNINSVKIVNSHVGMYNEAGNIEASGFTIQHCDTAYKQFGGTNSGHAVFSNSLFNHNTYNLVVDGLTPGQLFDGVMLYAGNVVIRNSIGIRFADCDFSTGTITLTNNTNLYRSGRWVNMTNSLVSGEGFNVLGETRTGAGAVPWIDQYSLIDTVRFRGPMFHNGVTPASASASDSVFVKDVTTGQLKMRAQSAIGGGGSGTDDSAYHRMSQLNDSTIIFHSNLAADTVVIRGGASGSGGGGAASSSMTISLLASNLATVVDATDYHFGNFVSAPNATATAVDFTIDRTCTLSSIQINTINGAAGSGEDWSLYVRVNDATDYLIQTVATTTGGREWANNAINISLTAGDKIVIKSAGVTWATNPTNLIFSGYARFVWLD